MPSGEVAAFRFGSATKLSKVLPREGDPQARWRLCYIAFDKNDVEVPR
jgi:hypothetical protein